MKPDLRHFGDSRSPVVVVDHLTHARDTIVDIAAGLAPFRASAGNYYPGLRRIITEADTAANAYVENLIEAAAPFIGGAFDVDGFDLLEASFSIVTAEPELLTAAQRAPHFDSLDPRYVAILHYLGDTPGSGTAWYRQRSTGIEIVDEGNFPAFVAAARREVAEPGYINGTNAHFEQIGKVEYVPDRLVIYRGAMLHSGIIPPGMTFSSDPRAGRLTANIFIKTHQERP